MSDQSINPDSHDLPPQSDKEQDLLSFTKILIDLIIHEDKHNWGKFYTFLYTNLGLFASSALIIKSPLDIKYSAIAGCIIAWIGILSTEGLRRDLHDGIDCLKGHKKQLGVIERRLRAIGLPSVLATRDGPGRISLIKGPRAVQCMWGIYIACLLPIIVLPSSVFIKQNERSVEMPVDQMAPAIDPTGTEGNTPSPADDAGVDPANHKDLISTNEQGSFMDTELMRLRVFHNVSEYPHILVAVWDREGEEVVDLPNGELLVTWQGPKRKLNQLLLYEADKQQLDPMNWSRLRSA